MQQIPVSFIFSVRRSIPYLLALSGCRVPGTVSDAHCQFPAYLQFELIREPFDCPNRIPSFIDVENGNMKYD